MLIPNPGIQLIEALQQLPVPMLKNIRLKKKIIGFLILKSLKKTGSVSVNGEELMFVNYPHMPTGQLPTKELFTQLVAFAKKHNILICHDNPYSFILNDKPMSMLSVEGAKDVVIELNSLSKSHNMAGWRVGILCGSKERIDDSITF